MKTIKGILENSGDVVITSLPYNDDVKIHIKFCGPFHNDKITEPIAEFLDNNLYDNIGKTGAFAVVVPIERAQAKIDDFIALLESLKFKINKNIKHKEKRYALAEIIKDVESRA